MEPSVVVVGGGGHVGLPLAIAFARAGVPTMSYDTNTATVAAVSRGEMPFFEEGAEPALSEALEAGTFGITDDPKVVAEAEFIIVVIGTPVDEHQNPDPEAVAAAISELFPYMHSGQLLVLRSTVYPGVTRRVIEHVQRNVEGVDVVFAPERIAQGKAMEELYKLPQIVGSDGGEPAERVSKLFANLNPQIVHTTPEEAELAKLFTNVWRYIKFAAANQFFMIANDAGLDYDRIRAAIKEDYPRADDLPGAGFAAGPCLLKDTLQLSAFEDNRFAIGHSAIMTNEGLPLYLVRRMQERWDLTDMTVGILGMAFKGDSDDTRSSLAFKLRRVLQFNCREVLCSDRHVNDDRLIPEDDMLARADIVVIGTPHREYHDLKFKQPVVDVWNLTGNGVII